MTKTFPFLFLGEPIGEPDYFSTTLLTVSFFLFFAFRGGGMPCYALILFVDLRKSESNFKTLYMGIFDSYEEQQRKHQRISSIHINEHYGFNKLFEIKKGSK